MSVWIDNELYKYVKTCVQETWPEKRVKCYAKPRSWQSSRWIQVSTKIKDADIHYEYYSGRVQLHFEGKFQTEEYRDLLRYLRNEIPSDGYFQWRNWQGMKQGLCEINHEVDSWEDVVEDFTTIVKRFDPVIQQFVDENPELFPNQSTVEYIPEMSYSIASPVGVKPVLETSIKPIGIIPFQHLVIPTYQRPYKWTAKNVNQLITDIISFSDKSSYRLGTLVLYNNEIVDGQQRIVTLSLILKNMLDRISDSRKRANYNEVIQNIENFVTNTKFPNRYSLHNVVENIHVIEARESDLTENILDFILEKCEFVVIELNNISEAFQFFDSQNARGKDLEAHDLLKAYHLREIVDMTASDSTNIDIWQKQKTDFLKDVFLMLYRAKRWSQGKGARFFTKDKTGIFKGISFRDGKRYPFYQMEIIAHVFADLYANDPVRKIDRNQMEYPFNLDDQIINGSRFFDMIRHYMELYRNLTKHKFAEEGLAIDILKLINNYRGMERTGDRYVKSMFYTLLLYYVDRFGFEEMDKVVPKFFIWAYTLRLESPAVQLASTDNYAKEYGSMIRRVHDAQTPYDIINLSQPSIQTKACTMCEEIADMFVTLKKFKR